MARLTADRDARTRESETLRAQLKQTEAAAPTRIAQEKAPLESQEASSKELDKRSVNFMLY